MRGSLGARNQPGRPLPPSRFAQATGNRLHEPATAGKPGKDAGDDRLPVDGAARVSVGDQVEGGLVLRLQDKPSLQSGLDRAPRAFRKNHRNIPPALQGLALEAHARTLSEIIKGVGVSPSFEIVSGISLIETIAVGAKIRSLDQLVELHGPGRWRKMKGVATVRLRSGDLRLAELHWYEAHGIGRVEIKRKRYLR